MTTPPKKRCFVVMGFGEKVDFQTGRKLNLDAAYHNMIKPTVEDAGLECVRADEIVHSGLIDVPMYEHLLKADVVIADLSTYNPNAFYELGVRHALRPYTTIVIAEEKLNYPFDVNHIVIRRYKHLGDDIGVGDARKFGAELKQALQVILDKQANDSPVYEFLNGLKPPMLEQIAEAVAQQAAQAPQAAAPQAGDTTLHALMQQASDALKAENFELAKAMLAAARAMKPEEPYLVQLLALATYKSKKPDPRRALEEARALLETLDVENTNDTETLGLWGAVHKRMWELDEREGRLAEALPHLDEAVRGYQRGYYLRSDHYNGINLAYLLNVRAAHAPGPEEAVADFVQARRIRREIIPVCERLLANADDDGPAEGSAMRKRRESRYWVLATLAEAHLGGGDKGSAEQAYQQAFDAAPESWMVKTTQEQRDKLEALLADSPLKYVRAE